MRMRIKHTLLDKVCPIAGVKDGFILSKSGDMTLGWELSLPVAFSLLESEYEALAESWASAIAVLPPWCIVHRQDAYVYEEYKPAEGKDFLDGAFEKHFAGRKYLTHHAYVFVTYSNKNRVLAGNQSSGLIKHFTDTLPKYDEALLSEYLTKGEEFATVLQRTRLMGARLLTDDDYLGTVENPGILQRYLMLGDSSPVMSDFRIDPDKVTVGDRELVSFCINEVEMIPSEVGVVGHCAEYGSGDYRLFMSWGSQLGVRLDCSHYVNHVIVTLPQEYALSTLVSKGKRMSSGASRMDNKVGNEEITSFLESVQKESRTIVKAHVNVCAFGYPQEMKEVKAKVSSALAAMGVTATYNLFDTPILFLSGIPGCISELGEDNLMTMELAASLCMGSLETFEGSVEGGLFKTVDRLRHIPVTIDLQRRSRELGWADNYNAFVLGPSGSGKSFFMNNYLHGCYAAGESVFIIDVGDSYEGLTQIVREESGGKDGNYFSWDREHPLSFNPFLGYDNWLTSDGKVNEEENGVNFFMSFLSMAWEPGGGWTSDMKAVLSQIVTDFVSSDRKNRQGQGSPVFDDFAEYVRNEVAPCIRQDEGRSAYRLGDVEIGVKRFDIDSFLLAIDPYRKGGKYGFLLNDPAPKDIFTTRWTVFEVDKLSRTSDKRFYSLVILCVLNSFDIKMRTSPEFKNLVIEEAWKAISNDEVAPYLSGLWKTSRKFQCAAMVVTQQLTDIKGSATIKDTILVNSSIRVLLDLSNMKNNFDEVRQFLGFSDIDANLAMSVNGSLDSRYRYKEVFIAWGTKKRGVYATEVSEEEAIAYESDKVKKRPVFEKAKELGSLRDAIRLSAEVVRSLKK